MPDEISGMGKTHGNASLICKKITVTGTFLTKNVTVSPSGRDY
jgi:hypothetical protein